MPRHSGETIDTQREDNSVTEDENSRENNTFPEFSQVGLTGFEPATSTPPVTGERSILRQKPWSTEHTVGCISTV
jgi:hypothetical protein